MPLPDFVPRLFNEPSESYFLFGPRGTGKSTMMRHRHKDALWIDLLLPQVLRRYLARPEYLIDIITASPKISTVIIDEIQKAPLLLSVVHSLIEQKKYIQFILTGSSARKLKRTSADLLGGRALKRIMHPFMAAELKTEFSLEKALKFGMLPLIYGQKNPVNTLNAYVSLYLQEEIQAEGLVRNLENFTRFLEVITFSHGSQLNISNVARESEVKRKTVENYINILEDLLLAFQLPIFTKRAQRELSAHSKFYLFDPGIFHILRPRGPLDSDYEMNGSLLEGLVAQHLKTWIDYSDEKYSLSYWRTRSGVEVDFVVYGPNEFWAIEVKNSKKINLHDTRSLQAFLEDYPMAKALLLYQGDEYIHYGKVLCMPCEKFLMQLIPNQNIVTRIIA